MAITSNDNFFDQILTLNDQKLAKAVVSHKRWEECVDRCSPDKPHPILRILDQMPDVYKIILDQSHTKCSLDPTHPDYWEEFNFKCLNVTLKDSTNYINIPVNAEELELGKSRAAARKRYMSMTAKRNKDSLAVVSKLVEHQLISYAQNPYCWGIHETEMGWNKQTRQVDCLACTLYPSSVAFSPLNV